MRPWWCFVSSSCLLGSVSISIYEEFKYLIRSMHFNLWESTNNNAFKWVFSQVKDITWYHDQVFDVFIIYFEEADSYGVVSIDLVLLHLLEYFLHCVEHDARILFIAKHRVCFASSSLSVGEYSWVITVEDTFAEKLGGILKDLQLGGAFIKRVVESILFFLCSILSKDLLLRVNISWIH